MRKTILIATLCITLEASAHCAFTAAFLAEGDQPAPVEVIVETYQRLLTEMSTGLAQSKRLHEFEKMLAGKGWLTPEIMRRLSEKTDRIISGRQTATAKRNESEKKNQPRILRFAVTKHEPNNISPDRRWLFFLGRKNQVQHQLVGNLETGEQVDLGPTDGEWAYLYFAMSQAGDAIAVAHPHAAKLKAHAFVAGQPKFTDPVQVERGRRIADFLLGHDNRERLRSLGPGPASHRASRGCGAGCP